MLFKPFNCPSDVKRSHIFKDFTPVSSLRSALDILKGFTVPPDSQEQFVVALRSLLALRAKYSTGNLNLPSKRDINKTAWINP